MDNKDSTQNIITSDDILGKDVVDTDGEIIGVVQQLRIDKKSKKMLGIVVDQGFMKPDLYIGLNLIKNFGIDSIFLNQSPKPKIKGLDVYDRKGKKLGFVFEISEDKKKNRISAIIMKKSQLGKSYMIKSKYIKTIGFSIILRVDESRLKMEEIKESGMGRELLRGD